MELCHCPVRVMGRDSYNFAFLRGVTNTAFMPARQREMAHGYVTYWCFTLSLSRVHWQNQNFVQNDVQISFRPILKTDGTMYWGSRVRTKFYGSIIDFGSERVFFNFKIIQTINFQLTIILNPFFNLNIYAHLCGHLLTLMCPFIILYALFFIKHKNLWSKNLISWQNFATLIYPKIQEPV